ncbi:MAG: hypothetical protein A3G87_08785 [Omnitrophica bacterium RIFCSPLOWO2_12_FULL_50_11]|nr:MAG: hypothetical protein A3G87_08785 [Omnitrophica bacterium RIFCSPLOWO2_12_FULL_50_11]
MNRSKIEKITELILILFLFFHVLWHLIYFERSLIAVTVNFFLLVIAFVYSVVRHWEGLKTYGIRFDNLPASLKATAVPLVAIVSLCLVVLAVKQRMGRWPQANEFLTFFLWGTFQQGVVQSYFLLRYQAIVGKKWFAVLLAALTFGLFHIPNPDLMLIAFFGGMYLSYFFWKWRNLFAVGFLHGMLSLTFIVTLKPAHAISDSYRVGPDSLGPTRGLIAQSLTPEHKIAEFIPSQIPRSFSDYFDGRVYPIRDFDNLKEFLQLLEPALVVLGQDDYAAFRSEFPEVRVYAWKSSLMWRRNFKNFKRDTLKCLLTLNFKKLDRLYRLPVVLISNKPLGELRGELAQDETRRG